MLSIDVLKFHGLWLLEQLSVSTRLTSFCGTARQRLYEKMISHHFQENRIDEVLELDCRKISPEQINFFADRVLVFRGMAKNTDKAFTLENLKKIAQNEEVKALDIYKNCLVKKNLYNLILDLQQNKSSEMLFSSTFFESYPELKNSINKWNWMPSEYLKSKVNFCRLLFRAYPKTLDKGLI